MKLETLDSLPEDLHGQFEEVEEDGKKYFQDKDSLELKRLAFNTKDENKNLKEKIAGFDEKFSEIEKQKIAAVEQAREDALEEARTKGDVKAIEERYKQQMADIEKRALEQGKNEAKKEMSQAQAKEKAANIAENIGAKYGVDEDSAEAITQLIKNRIEVDPDTGDKIFKDASGGATSLDNAGFIAELKKEGVFKRLMKNEVATTGGGLAQGSGNGSGAGGKNQQAEEAKKKGDLSGFLKARLKV